MISAVQVLLLHKAKLSSLAKNIRQDETIPWEDREAAIQSIVSEMNEMEHAIKLITNDWSESLAPSRN